MCLDKVLDDDDNGYDSLYGWDIKDFDMTTFFFCAWLATKQT